MHGAAGRPPARPLRTPLTEWRHEGHAPESTRPASRGDRAPDTGLEIPPSPPSPSPFRTFTRSNPMPTPRSPPRARVATRCQRDVHHATGRQPSLGGCVRWGGLLTQSGNHVPDANGQVENGGGTGGNRPSLRAAGVVRGGMERAVNKAGAVSIGSECARRASTCGWGRGREGLTHERRCHVLLHY